MYFGSIPLANSGAYDTFIGKYSSTWVALRATKWW
jgi:hypothetical protein